MTIYVALGQHVDFWHSYRGDSPTEDGFGHDFDVIGRSLDVLERHPGLVCDWDWECARALRDALPHDPALLARLVSRVRDSGDVVRHISWAGEILSALTEDEFTESFRRSRADLTATFGAENLVEGCYPQECMYTPALPRRLRGAGVEWVSLFYGACGFTAFRRDVRLDGAEAYNPLRLFTPEGDAWITLVPMYNHGDLLDFGDMNQWLEAVAESCGDDDGLLHVSFDADSITWPPFLEATAAALDTLDFVRCCTVDRYLETHAPLRDVTLHRDLADGAMDGYGNWSEKPVNFRMWTSIVEGRRRGAPVERRLLAAKTTNFGLATPLLHPDRMATVDGFVAELGTAELARPALGSGAPDLPAGRIEAHRSARFSAPEPFGDGGIAFWVTVTFGDDVDEDAVEPCAIVLDWALPVTVHKADFCGARSTYDIVEDQDSVNNHLTPEWAAFGAADGSGVLVAFDERVLAGPAALPLRVRGGEVRVNPFGTYWGRYPDMHPEWTGGSGQAHEVVPLVGSHYHSSSPAFAGATLTFRLGVVAFEGPEPSPPPAWPD
ncbi:MAG: hypothetical protein U0U69_12825 [Acidimicrobiia bacterium]